ncbi:hypothetical protein [Microbacterium karelineae]|uniref:hypothetical protein n=1 Tax=Microbacterium karelineae TaxID=2654283 RepID=UPI0012EA7A05|nr:hypothetical protein [Microbacterium karelineae]
MTRHRSFSPDYAGAARTWFEEVLQAARDVHVMGERRAAEGILLSMDRWFIDRDAVRHGASPLTELAMVVSAILGDGTLPRPTAGDYAPETSVLGNPIGAHITLTFDDADLLGHAVLEAIPVGR